VDGCHKLFGPAKYCCLLRACSSSEKRYFFQCCSERMREGTFESPPLLSDIAGYLPPLGSSTDPCTNYLTSHCTYATRRAPQPSRRKWTRHPKQQSLHCSISSPLLARCSAGWMEVRACTQLDPQKPSLLRRPRYTPKLKSPGETMAASFTPGGLYCQTRNDSRVPAGCEAEERPVRPTPKY
jgi:hypothetical protein